MFNHSLNSMTLAINETGVVKNVNTKKLVALDPDRKSVQAAQFETELRHRVAGQERAVRKLASIYQVFQAGMTNPTRPIGTMLFLDLPDRARPTWLRPRLRCCSETETPSLELIARNSSTLTRSPS